MRRNLALLLTSLLLVFSLTACGGDKKDDGTNDNVGGNGVTNGETNGTNDVTGNGDGVDHGTDDGILGGTSGDTGTPDPLPTDDPVTGTTDGANQQNARVRGATYGQMLRNGRVHDTDGFLKDLENSVTPGTV